MKVWKRRDVVEGGGGIAGEGGRMGFLMGNQRVVLSTNEFEKGLVFTANDNEFREAAGAYCPFVGNPNQLLCIVWFPR